VGFENVTRLRLVPRRVPPASIDLHIDTRGLRREKEARLVT